MDHPKHEFDEMRSIMHNWLLKSVMHLRNKWMKHFYWECLCIVLEGCKRSVLSPSPYWQFEHKGCDPLLPQGDFCSSVRSSSNDTSCSLWSLLLLKHRSSCSKLYGREVQKFWTIVIWLWCFKGENVLGGQFYLMLPNKGKAVMNNRQSCFCLWKVYQ